MPNMYVNQMKRVMEKYLEQQRAGNAQIVRNRDYYMPEIAEEKNNTIRAKQAEQYTAAQNEIENIFSNVRRYLANANFPNVGYLTADRFLFESGISLSPAEIEGFVERYKMNFTMLRLLRDYIQRQPQSLTLNRVLDEIHLPDEQLQVYKWFCEESLKILHKISVNGLILQDPIEIDLFDSEALSTVQEKLDVIKDGQGLSDYGSADVPESAKHQFDSILLTAHTAQANLYSRSV